MTISARDRLVFPLDVKDLAEARGWIDRLRGHVGVFKVGLELFVSAGPDAISAVHDRGARCFLDLKLHDIPATMAGATERAVAREVAFLTVHASAGPRALRGIAEIARGSRTQILAVTILTSFDAAELASIGLDAPSSAAARLAKVATDAGVRGLVCSPEEAGTLKAIVGPEGLLMVPGVRPAGTDHGDQRRVATPASAIASGADYLVVGRPIREAADPVAAAGAIVREIAAALEARS
ncbi:MAG: orotidine-5'-phosphate decarboxylase [Deltaproteobacteria bacterium]|nr:orotidine-5'-phosphate decarboxylase [Deltaproteobacteria bacterium]